VAAAMVGSANHPSGAAPRTFSSGGGPGGGSGPTVQANVTLNDAPSFDPSTLTASAGDALQVHLTNNGTFSHTFTVSAVPNHVLNRSWSPMQLTAFFHANGSLANVSVAPATSAWANFLNVSGTSGPGVQLTVQTAGAGLAFVPDALGANATKFPIALDVAVSNLGSTGHTWTLVSQPNVNLTPGNFSTYFSAHPALASVTVPTTPGQVIWANFTVDKAGVYQFLCEIPGHFAAGMVGYLYVGVPVPASAAAPSTAIVQPLLLAGAGALLGIGGLLAVVASFVGRLPPPALRPHH